MEEIKGINTKKCKHCGKKIISFNKHRRRCYECAKIDHRQPKKARGM